MRAFSVSISFYPSCPLLQASSATPTNNPSIFPSKFMNLNSRNSSLKFFFSQSRPTPYSSNSDSALLEDDNFDDDDDNGYCSVGEGSGSGGEDGIFIQIKKLGRNSRRIRSRISINASLDAVWNILTDYERLADFIPGLAVSKLIEKKDNCARLFQIGQQNLPLGLKFNAKAILDCFEKDVETFDSKTKRDIEFKMSEGDFQFFEGKWSIEQVNKRRLEGSDCSVGQEFETTLSYYLDVKPKLWLPVHLVEGRLCNEIQTNLSCIREEAQKVICNTLRSQECN